jgi:hypothetical protein
LTSVKATGHPFQQVSRLILQVRERDGERCLHSGVLAIREAKQEAKEQIMDYEAQIRRLTLAEFDIALGLERIRRQWEVIIGLEREGCDSKTAHQLLDTLLKTQAIQEENRETILSRIH